MLPTSPGAHKVSLKDNLDVIFQLDKRVADASPTILPLESPKELLKFLTVEHSTDTYIWNDKEGNLIGFLSLMDDKDDQNIMEILNICIDPIYQRKGHGKQMMSFSEDLAKKLGKKKTQLVTNTKNEQAISFYKKNEYKIAKMMEDYYGDGENRYLFQKEL